MKLYIGYQTTNAWFIKDITYIGEYYVRVNGFSYFTIYTRKIDNAKWDNQDIEILENKKRYVCLLEGSI